MPHPPPAWYSPQGPSTIPVTHMELVVWVRANASMSALRAPGRGPGWPTNDFGGPLLALSVRFPHHLPTYSSTGESQTSQEALLVPAHPVRPGPDPQRTSSPQASQWACPAGPQGLSWIDVAFWSSREVRGR